MSLSKNAVSLRRQTSHVCCDLKQSPRLSNSTPYFEVASTRSHPSEKGGPGISPRHSSLQEVWVGGSENPVSTVLRANKTDRWKFVCVQAKKSCMHIRASRHALLCTCIDYIPTARQYCACIILFRACTSYHMYFDSSLTKTST